MLNKIKMKFMMIFLTIVVSIFVGYHIGYQQAHVMVAKECERLGSFFVGKKVYQCVKIRQLDE